MIQDRYDSGPSSLMIAAMALLTLIVIIMITIGGWKLGWWLKGANQDNQYEVNIRSQQYQAGLVQAERDRVQGWDLATDPGQKAQIKATFCPIYLTLTKPPADLSLANARICS